MITDSITTVPEESEIVHPAEPAPDTDAFNPDNMAHLGQVEEIRRRSSLDWTIHDLP